VNHQLGAIERFRSDVQSRLLDVDEIVRAGRRRRRNQRLVAGTAAILVLAGGGGALGLALTSHGSSDTQNTSVGAADTSAGADAVLHYVAGASPDATDIVLDHTGEYHWQSPKLPASEGLPGSSSISGHVVGGGIALISVRSITPEYTTAGTYLDVVFNVDRADGSPTYRITQADAEPLPPEANQPQITPPPAHN
jgi:hypothetical protein